MPEPAPALSWPTLRRGILRAAVVVGLSLGVLAYTYTRQRWWKAMDLGFLTMLVAGHLAAGGRVLALSCVERWLALRAERAGPKVWGLIFLATWASSWLANLWTNYLRLLTSTRSIPQALTEAIRSLGYSPTVHFVSALWGLSLLALVALRLRGVRLRHQIVIVATISTLAGAANMTAFGFTLGQIDFVPYLTHSAILVLGWRAGDWLADRRWGAQPIARAEVQAALAAAEEDGLSPKAPPPTE